ncbi:hypothetical protein E2C01_051744 [Portunus trituberculatus]|uniref:Uncharacterized protein n=1 Tax=Portunus trituberculatus TaxID=210409 RepID=A0A5B7GKE2_PORTR|nr:hypothetical protein [Portunus trituberculatus]
MRKEARKMIITCNHHSGSNLRASSRGRESLSARSLLKRALSVLTCDEGRERWVEKGLINLVK